MIGPWLGVAVAMVTKSALHRRGDLSGELVGVAFELVRWQISVCSVPHVAARVRVRTHGRVSSPCWCVSECVHVCVCVCVCV